MEIFFEVSYYKAFDGENKFIGKKINYWAIADDDEKSLIEAIFIFIKRIIELIFYSYHGLES